MNLSGLARGAFAFHSKPTTREELQQALARIKEYTVPRLRRLLIVEDNPAEQMSITALLEHDDVEIETAGNGAEALTALRTREYDCAVLDLPVVVFTGKALSPEEDARLHTLARSVVVKGVESPERLLDETALFLHRVIGELPPDMQAMLDRLRRSDDDLIGRKVLVVDDDVRNIFALSSVLERRGMQVLTAGTGHEAIEMLARTPGIAIVLMDIMMPEMDGYQTMRSIRQNPGLRRLPIVALTAKAMKGDREKCLEAGAPTGFDTHTVKPVDITQRERLLALA